MARVRLFAQLRELAGSGELAVDAPDVRAVVAALAERFGARFAEIAAAGSVVVNGEVAGDDVTLGLHDEVALLPPFSGG